MAPCVKVNGEKIRRLREQVRCLERSEVAEALGISRHNVYLIEVHRQTTAPRTLRRLARLLGVRPAELVDHHGLDRL